jgi:hypothetical protein
MSTGGIHANCCYKIVTLSLRHCHDESLPKDSAYGCFSKKARGWLHRCKLLKSAATVTNCAFDKTEWEAAPHCRRECETIFFGNAPGVEAPPSSEIDLGRNVHFEESRTGKACNSATTRYIDADAIEHRTYAMSRGQHGGAFTP